MKKKLKSSADEQNDAHKQMCKEWVKYLKRCEKQGYSASDCIPAQIWADAFAMGYRCRLEQQLNLVDSLILK